MGTKKHRHGPAPIPPANQAHIGPATSVPNEGQQQGVESSSPETSGFQDQDAQRRLGNFETAGEHAIQQPGGRNDSHGKPTRGSDK